MYIDNEKDHDKFFCQEKIDCQLIQKFVCKKREFFYQFNNNLLYLFH